MIRFAIICALCLSLGAQWMALQSVAWGTMILRGAQHVSLARAISQTFDGDHPCALCKAINAAQHSQRKHDARITPVKHDFICATSVVTLLPRSIDFSFPVFRAVPSTRVDAPPTPPPRAALG